MPPGIGADYPIQLLVGPPDHSQSAQLTYTLYYAPPHSDSVDGSPIPAAGGTITVHGDNFGDEVGNVKVTFGMAHVVCTAQAAAKSPV